MPTTNLPFHVGDYGSRIQLTVTNQNSQLVTMNDTVVFEFTGCVGDTTKTAVIQSTGIAYWVVTDGFFTQAGTAKVRAVITNTTPAVYTSSWATFTVQE